MRKTTSNAHKAVAVVATASAIAFSAYFMEGCGAADRYRYEKDGKVAVLQHRLDSSLKEGHWQFQKDIASLYPAQRWAAENKWRQVGNALRESIYRKNGDTAVIDVDLLGLKWGELAREMMRWGVPYLEGIHLDNAERKHTKAINQSALKPGL